MVIEISIDIKTVIKWFNVNQLNKKITILNLRYKFYIRYLVQI